MRRVLFVPATAAVLAAAAVSAQTAADRLPPNPGDRPPVPGVVAPEPQTSGPAASAVGGQQLLTLQGIRLKGATAIPAADLAENWQDVLGKPVSFEALETIAARIEADYRAAGYVLSQVVLPAQDVAGGVVEMLVVEGFVEDVTIQGGDPKEQKFVQGRFADVAGERPAQLRTIERAVLLSRDSLGGTVESVETVLEPSPDTFGAADMTVLVDPDPYSAFISVDNRGSRLSGPWTVIGGGTTYGLLGLNERLDFIGASSLGDGQLSYGLIDSSFPLASLNGTALDGAQFQFGGDYSYSDPDLENAGSPSDLTLRTREWNLRAGISVPFIRSRSENLFGRLGFILRETESQTILEQILDETSTDRLSILEARLSWDKADQWNGINLVDGLIHQGMDVAGAEVSADGPAAGDEVFTSFRFNLGRLQRFGQSDWSLKMEAQGQLASTVLPESERFALGNSTIGRGFAPGNTTGDEGYGVRLEMRRDVRGNWINDQASAVQLYGFGDYGEAYDKAKERDGELTETLASYGVGARFDFNEGFSLNGEVTRQADGVANDTTDPDHETRVFVNGVFRF